MKKVVYKLYYDFEKEEKWLNEMSSKGFALVDFFMGKYTFEECEKGEYIYRIELLENLVLHSKSKQYINFLEETGVEHVASSFRWAFFRKKASLGEFDIYSDIDSKIEHYKKIITLFGILGFAETSIGISNINIGTLNHTEISGVNSFLGGLCFFIGIVFMSISLKYIFKMNKLKKEKIIKE